MNIGIFYFSRKRTAFENAQETPFIKAAQQYPNLKVFPLFETLITVTHDKDGLELFYDQKPFPACDAIVCRTAIYEEPSLHSVTSDFLKQKGYLLINEYPTVSLSKNKLAQHLILSQAGVPMPDWAIIRWPDQVENVINKIGFPMILKIPIGGRGKGVFYVENEKTLQPIIDYLHVRDRNPVIIQRFIKEAQQKDIRVFVIGNKVVAAMQREAKKGDVRANIGSGGLGSIFPLYPEIELIALAATKAMTLEIAGVDIILSKDGPLVMEVNACPGLDEIQAVTGKNIAGQILDYAIEKIYAHK
jgi:ribosomal protein S6--L-glutamate ligase